MLLNSNNISGDLSIDNNEYIELNREGAILDKFDNFISPYVDEKELIKLMINYLESKL